MTESSGDNIKIHIKTSQAEKVEILTSSTRTVEELKVQISEKCNVEPSLQRLIFKGRVLKDHQTVGECEIKDGNAIHLVKGKPPSASPPTQSTPAPSSGVPNNNNSNTPSPAPGSMPNPFGTNGANPFANMMGGGAGGANPFAGMMGGMGGMGGMPNMEQMQQQLQQNPQLMQQMMNSPMMQSLLDDPATLQNMMMSNPAIQSMLDSNPQMRHVLNDPQLMRQTMEMMRNPAAMQEAQRHQDIALSQIENHPEGFNALRRMYEDVQEPMMEAARMQQPQGQQQQQSTPRSTQPTNSAVPNPWGNNNNANAGSAGTGGAGAMPNPFANMMGGGAVGANPFAGMMGGMGGTGAAGGGFPPGMAQMMQNPQMMQMMRQMMSNPAMLDQLAASDPNLGRILQNPQMRSMLSNPQFLEQMMNPANMQAMMQLQQMQSNLGMGGGIGGGVGGMNNGGLDFNSLLNQMNAGAGGIPGAGGSTSTTTPGGIPSTTPATPPVPQVDPAVSFASQNQQLQEMGFSDAAANIRALQRTQGNVSAAIERLLSGN